ncbi:BTB/POZ domain-containing protein isoform 2 [Cladophialophora immunda]|nr:BTB/POZ domain-containing protein isoform 2 [Cladophialophora immunda]
MHYHQEIVTVSVEPRGEEPHQFKIHKPVLCSHSPRFRDFFEDEAEAKVMVLWEVSVEGFETFSRWLYTKKLAVEEMEQEMEKAGEDSGETAEDSDDSGERGDRGLDEGEERDGGDTSLTNGMQKNQNFPREADIEADSETANDSKTRYAGVNRKGRVFARLLDLYIFADTYKTVSFKNVVMLGFQRYVASSEILPHPTIVKHALDNLDLESPMCKYLTRCYGHYTDFKKANKKRFATLSPTFLTEVLLIAFRRIDAPDVDDWDDNWCDYHEHESDQSRADCKKERPEDADIVKKQPKPRRRWGGCC